MKKSVRLLCLLMVLSVFLGMALPAAAVNTADQDSPVNYVVVVDISGSTENSDEMKVCEMAAQMLVDQLPVQGAQVGVVVFGHKDYAKCYKFKVHKPSSTADIARVRELVSLQPTANLADKERIFTQVDKIDVLAEEAAKQDRYGQSPQGLAVAAAVDMLLAADSAKGRACILVLSDGVRKSTSATRGDFTQIESAASDIAKANKWPIFCLRLAGETDLKASEIKQAKEDMDATAVKTEAFVDQNGNNKIDQAERGAFAVHGLEDVSKAIMKILAQYTDGETITLQLDENGYATVKCPIGELTSEASFSVSGVKLERLDITASNGKRLCSVTGNEETDRYIAMLRRGPIQDYISAKLICPDADEVIVEVHGKANASVDILRCSAKDVQLELEMFSRSSEAEEWKKVTGEEVLSKDDQIRFEAYFVYRNHRFANCSIYTSTNPALTVENLKTGAPLPSYTMSGDENGYFYEMSMRELGNADAQFRASAEVVSDILKDGMMRSNYADFKTEDVAPTLIDDTIPGQTAGMNMDIVINLDNYISNPDGDAMTLTTECVSDNRLKFKVDQPDSRTLVLNTGMVAGEFDLVFSLKDKAVAQPFELKLALVIDMPQIHNTVERIRLVSDDKFPEFMAAVCGEKILSQDITDAFYAEGLELMITDCVPEKDGIVACTNESGIWTVNSVGKGKTVLNVTMNAGMREEIGGIVEYVMDGSGEQAVYTETIEVEVVSRWDIFWEKFGLIIIAAIVVIIVLLCVIIFREKGKSMKNSWSVTVSTQNKQIYETRRPIDLAEYSEKEITLEYLMQDQVEQLLDVLRNNVGNANTVRTAIKYWRDNEYLSKVKLCATYKHSGFVLKKEKALDVCTIRYGERTCDKAVQVDTLPVCIEFKEGDNVLKITMTRTADEDNDY